MGPLGLVGTFAESTTLTESTLMTSRATPETSSAILLAISAVRWGSVPVTSSVRTREVMEVV